jgi:hypothetical protein
MPKAEIDRKDIMQIREIFESVVGGATNRGFRLIP